MGRVSTFTQEVADAIIERLSKGEPLAAICGDENMPAVRTVSDWKAAHQSFAADFAHAREAGFDVIAATCLEIAEDGSHDYKHVKRSNGEEYEEYDAEHVQRSKLRIETRLKLLAKWDPKRYGERVQTEVSGPDGGPVRQELSWAQTAAEAIQDPSSGS
jgi:hypothetical protein